MPLKKQVLARAQDWETWRTQFLLIWLFFPVVLTVHDEIICEVDGYDANVVRFQELMEQSPGWAEDMGIPIAVETWVGTRYRK